VRDGPGLIAAVDRLAAYATAAKLKPTLVDYDLRSIYVNAGLIARCALAREESRGGHYRSDFPVAREEFRRASMVRLNE
jgi:L-aspartate oxidase